MLYYYCFKPLSYLVEKLMLFSVLDDYICSSSVLANKGLKKGLLLLQTVDKVVFSFRKSTVSAYIRFLIGKQPKGVGKYRHVNIGKIQFNKKNTLFSFKLVLSCVHEC